MSPASLLFPNSPVTLADFSYIQKSHLYDVEKPYYYSGPLPEDQEHLRTNIGFTTHTDIPTYDIRGREGMTNLDTHGFEFRVVPTATNISEPVVREDEIAGAYMEEVAAWLKDKTAAELVLCYNCRVRYANHTAVRSLTLLVQLFSFVRVVLDKIQLPGSPGREATQICLQTRRTLVGGSFTQGQTVQGARTETNCDQDQTLEGGFRRAKRHMTAAEAEKYLDGNWRIRIVKQVLSPCS